MVVSAYEHFSPVGDTDSVLYSAGSIETVEMDDHRVGDLSVGNLARRCDILRCWQAWQS